MRYFLLFLLVPSFCFAQLDSAHFKNDPDNKNSIIYDSVIVTPGSKDEVFSKEKIWVIETLKYPTGPGILFDKEIGMISFKTSTTILTKYDHVENKKKKIVTHHQNFYDAEFKITLFAKEGKGKIIISNISYKDGMYRSGGFWSIDNNFVEKSKKKTGSDDIQESVDGENNLIMIRQFDNYFQKLVENFCTQINSKSKADF